MYIYIYIIHSELVEYKGFSENIFFLNENIEIIKYYDTYVYCIYV